MKNLALFQNVTPNDSADITGARWEYLVVPAAGAVAFTTHTNAVAVTVNLPAGIWPIPVKRILATGTTATNLSVAL